MFAPLVGYFCASLCAAALSLTPTPSYDPNSTETVRLFGVPVGAYVDDTQPHECQAVAAEKAAGALVVIAGEGTSGGPSCPGAVMAREWYPFGCGTASSWGPIPGAGAYILQRRFAWPHCRHATPRQQALLFAQAKRRHPFLILWY